MKNSKENITGILLAGGKSSRMGHDKGMIKIGKHNLFEYPLHILENICNEVIISTCQPQGTYGNWPHLCDEFKGIGPLGGIYTCLKASPTETNIILSYDLPLVNTDLLQYLLSKTEANEIVLPATNIQKPQPLCGIYNKRILKKIENQIASGDYSVYKLLPETNSRICIIHKELSWYHEDIFLNVNTKEDIDKVLSSNKLL